MDQLLPPVHTSCRPLLNHERPPVLAQPLGLEIYEGRRSLSMVDWKRFRSREVAGYSGSPWFVRPTKVEKWQSNAPIL